MEQPGPRLRGFRWWQPRRTRAEQAATLLDGQRPPTDAAELRLVNAAAALRDLPTPRMSPVRRNALRAHLLAALTDTALTEATPAAPTASDPAQSAEPAMARGSGATGRRVRRVSPRQARVLRTARPLLAISLACAVALVGLAVSTEDALPGETLYGVKRRVENIQVSLVRDPIAKAKTRLDVAVTRMDELRTITLGQGTHIDRPTGAANQPPPGPASLLQPTDPFAQLWTAGTGLPLPRVRPVAPAGPIQAPPPSRPAAPVLPSPPAASPPTAAPAASAITATTTTAASATPAGSATAAAAAALAASGHHTDAGTVNSLLRAWCAQARAGSRVLLARAATGNADAWTTMDAFTTEQSDRLAPILAALPPGTSEAAQATLDLIDEFRLGLRFPRATATAVTQPASTAPTAAPTSALQEAPSSAAPSAPTSPDDAESTTMPTSTTTPTPASRVSGTPDEDASHGRAEVSRAAESAEPSAAAQRQPSAPSTATPARQAGESSPVPAVRAPNPPKASPPSSPTSAPVDMVGTASTGTGGWSAAGSAANGSAPTADTQTPPGTATG